MIRPQIMNINRWLLSFQFKFVKPHKNNGGFTLIELLVAMILAVLVITPLLGFMLNVLNTDRQEQVKAMSEQEIQSALDYITRDLEQALYVYDATGVTAIQAQLPTITGGTPVLVFWKREMIENGFSLKDSKNSNITDDSFVYSLVAYYLVKDTNQTWSKAGRISRVQIKDGVASSNGNTCTSVYNTTEKFSICPDKSYSPFIVPQKGKTLQQSMNSWTVFSKADYPNPVVLVDHIDQTPTAEAPEASCPANSPSGVKPEIAWSKIPASPQMTGFYVCVDSLAGDNKSIVEVYLRGNALTRLRNDEPKYTGNNSSYFPGASARVQGRSFIFNR
jgi:prepilin-type N-terminal cleavage/methylation domain-containing protein